MSSQALDHLMSEMNGIPSPDKCNFCGIRTAEYVFKYKYINRRSLQTHWQEKIYKKYYKYLRFVSYFIPPCARNKTSKNIEL